MVICQKKFWVKPQMFQGEVQIALFRGEIRAVKLQESFEKTVLNYKKNGEYSCLIKGYPVFFNKRTTYPLYCFERQHKTFPMRKVFSVSK
jgi:hypothetical protein